MSILRSKIRYGFRLLKRNPAFAGLAVCTLALCIAGESVIFSIVNAVVIQPLPYQAPRHLATVWETQSTNPQVPVSPDDFNDWREQSKTFSELAAFSIQGLSLASLDLPVRVNGAIVSPNFFQVFGVNPIRGRTFTSADIQPGAGRMAVISSGLWRRVWSNSESVLGKQIILNDLSFTVIGVMPGNFDFTRLTDVWLSPQQWTPEPPIRVPSGQGLRNLRYLRVVGRIKPEADFKTAQAEMETIAIRLSQQYPETNREIGIRIVPLYEEVVGNVKTSVLFLFGAMIFVLLIACSNIAGLLLSRAVVREKEFAVRLALGGSPWQIFQQLLVEGMILSMISGGIGLLAAYWSIEALPALLPTDFPMVNEIRLNGMVITVTLAVSLLSGIIVGLAPAIQSLKTDVASSLKSATRSASSSRAQQRFRSGLIIAEVALSLVLLIGAGLMLKSFYNIRNLRLGFDPDSVLTMQISLPRSRYNEPQKVIDFYTQLLQQLKTAPGIKSVGVTNRLPLTGTGTSGSFNIQGRVVSPKDQPRAEWRMVNPDYFRSMAIPLKSGRLIEDRDLNGPNIVLINEVAAKRYWPSENPLGMKISIDPKGEKWLEIVGVVGTMRGASLYAEPTAEIYLPYFQYPWNNMALIAKLDSAIAVPSFSLFREKVQAIDKSQPVDNIRFLGEIVDESRSQPRFNLTLIWTFAAVALVLAAIGLYGVMTTLVTQRRYEIGIRMTMGARPKDILRMVLKRGLILVAVGSLIGLCLAFALNRSVTTLLFNVDPLDMMVYVSAIIFLLLITIAANLIPAYRASRLSPAVAVRDE